MATYTHKERYSQFYTVGDPFKYQAFQIWFSRIPSSAKNVLLEPFAGANHIVNRFPHHDWATFDIDPKHESIRQRDTLAEFPLGYPVCITNPPYIAKNAARRQGIPYPDTAYDDVYQLALHRMLDNCEWVAAIIPESFATSGLFRGRLQALLSVPERIFDDTDCPVCVAMFGPDETPDFDVWSGDSLLGPHSQLVQVIPESALPGLHFNDPLGLVGILGVDNTRGASIQFVEGEAIPQSAVKPTSRSRTRVSSPHFSPRTVNSIIERSNEILHRIRRESQDVFLTAFKGLRVDGKYRRRLDYTLARRILTQAILELT